MLFISLFPVRSRICPNLCMDFHEIWRTKFLLIGLLRIFSQILKGGSPKMGFCAPSPFLLPWAEPKLMISKQYWHHVIGFVKLCQIQKLRRPSNDLGLSGECWHKWTVRTGVWNESYVHLGTMLLEGVWSSKYSPRRYSKLWTVILRLFRRVRLALSTSK